MYSDADCAGDPETRRSTTEICLHLEWRSWNSRLQPTIAVSRRVAEYMVLAQAVRNALWLKKLLGDFDIKVKAMPIFTDSQGILKLLKHLRASMRSEHTDVIHHFARKRMPWKKVCVPYCSSGEMVADCFPSLYQSGSIFQAWVLRKSFSLLQICL